MSGAEDFCAGVLTLKGQALAHVVRIRGSGDAQDDTCEVMAREGNGPETSSETFTAAVGHHHEDGLQVPAHWVIPT